MKRELEEEIFNLEDELRLLVAERRARQQEMEIRSEIIKRKLEYISSEYEAGNVSESSFVELKNELDAEIEELETRKRMKV